MEWLTSNLLLVAILGGLFVIVSFVRIRVAKPNWIFLVIGVALQVAFAVGVSQVVRNPPGLGKTVEEKEPDDPPADIPDSALDRLRLDWNSEAVANWPASETLAEISDIAYQPPHEADATFRELGFTKVMPVVQGSMIGYIVSGEDVTVIVFRGTDFNEVSDWIANLGTSSTETRHGRVHRGFYNAYQSMKSQVDAILEGRDTTHLWLTGHSLGGALAVVGAYDLVESEQQTIDGIMTFGQPLIARQQFANHLNRLLDGQYARFVNRDDVVPRLPPGHVAGGSLVWFTDSGVRRSSVRRRMLYSADAANEPPDEDVGGRAEITPLTEAEFEDLQAELRAGSHSAEQPLELPPERLRKRTPERLRDRTPKRLRERLPMAYRAAPSLIDDHYMRYYVDEVRSLLGVTGSEEPQ